MEIWLGRLLVGVFLGLVVGLLAAALGCGGGAGPTPEVNLGAAPAERSGPVFVALPPTATAWPTFTPVPTVVSAPASVAESFEDVAALEFGEVVEETVELEFLPTFTPTAAPAATFTPLPSSTPVPTEVLVDPLLFQGSSYDSDQVVPLNDVGGGPGPAPYGKLPGAEVYFDRQSFFVLQLAEVPGQILENNFAMLPDAMDVVPSNAPFLVWLVVYDLSRVDGQFEADLTVRWIDLKFPDRPLVMFRSPVRLAWNEPLFWNGLGEFGGGFWQPGHYKVELIDQIGNILIDWEFRVI